MARNQISSFGETDESI